MPGNANRTPDSRVHDLAGTLMGGFALAMLITSPWQVDTTGPDPFYKGPLIFPVIVFGIMLAGALPSVRRLIRPVPGADWTLDGHGRPVRNLVILGLLVLFLGGLVFLGLEISTWLFLVLAMKITGQDSPGKLLLFPAAITLLLFLVFKLFLDIWFPQPLVLDLMAALAGGTS